MGISYADFLKDSQTKPAAPSPDLSFASFQQEQAQGAMPHSAMPMSAVPPELMARTKAALGNFNPNASARDDFQSDLFDAAQMEQNRAQSHAALVGGMAAAPALSYGHFVRGLYREGMAEPNSPEMEAAQKEGLEGGYQTLANAMAAGPVGQAIGRVLAPAIGSGAAGYAASMAPAAMIGATYDPEHPVRGAAVGATIGGVANAVSPYRPTVTREVPNVHEPAPERPWAEDRESHLLENPNEPTPRATATYAGPEPVSRAPQDEPIDLTFEKFMQEHYTGQTSKVPGTDIVHTGPGYGPEDAIAEHMAYADQLRAELEKAKANLATATSPGHLDNAREHVAGIEQSAADHAAEHPAIEPLRQLGQQASEAGQTGVAEQLWQTADALSRGEPVPAQTVKDMLRWKPNPPIAAEESEAVPTPSAGPGIVDYGYSQDLEQRIRDREAAEAHEKSFVPTSELPAGSLKTTLGGQLALHPESGYWTNGHVMFPADALASTKAGAKMVEQTSGWPLRNGTSTADMSPEDIAHHTTLGDKVWKPGIESATEPAAIVGGQIGEGRTPHKAFAVTTGEKPEVIPMNAQYLKWIQKAVQPDELRVPANRGHAMMFYKAGKPVALLMPLRATDETPSLAELLQRFPTAEPIGGAPKAPKPKAETTSMFTEEAFASRPVGPKAPRNPPPPPPPEAPPSIGSGEEEPPPRPEPRPRDDSYTGPPVKEPAGSGTGMRMGFEPGWIDEITHAMKQLVVADPARASAAEIMTAKLGYSAAREQEWSQRLKEFGKMVGRMSAPDQIEFIDRMEMGRAQKTDRLERLAGVMREMLDDAARMVQRADPKALQNLIENYFPHIWENPKRAQDVLRALMARNPFEGPAAFKKMRTIATTKVGLQAGLTPVTYNPIDLVLLKLREMNRYATAHQIFNDLKKRGLLKYRRLGKPMPEGYANIDDKIAEVWLPPEVPIKEAFDAEVRRALEQTIRNLDAIRPLEYDRPTKMPKGTLGQAWRHGGKLEAMFGSESIVLMHELGHILDFRYGLYNYLTSSDDVEERKAVRQELGDLAEERISSTAPRYASKGYRAYLHSREEQVANAVHAYLYAPDLMKRMAPNAYEKMTEFLREHKPLQPLQDLGPSLTVGSSTRMLHVGPRPGGDYVAPRSVAGLLNDHLSPGLRGKWWYDAYTGIGNLMNQLQLFGGFHLGFTSMDASVSKMALGLQQLMNRKGWDRLGGAATIAETPIAALTGLHTGYLLKKEYMQPGSVGGLYTQLAQAIKEAGGRVTQDPFYHNNALKNLVRAAQRVAHHPSLLVKGKSAVGLPARTIAAILEQASRPIMEYIVPYQKLAVFANLAREELRKVGEGATPLERRAALQRAWRSVDNRMGQLVYDNLFWHKTFRDVSHMAVRSVGWHLGEFREIGGGALDAAKLPFQGVRELQRGKKGEQNAQQLRELMLSMGAGGGGGKLPPPLDRQIGAAGRRQAGLPGDKPEVTSRTAYVLAFALLTGIAGAAITKLFTGKNPEGKDYIYPPDGTTDEYGNPNRISLPTYAKDVAALQRHPLETLTRWLHPEIVALSEFWKNEDFWGNRLYDPHPSGPLQTLQEILTAITKEAKSFSLSNYQEAQRRGSSRSPAPQLVGITPAPKEVVRTPAQNLMQEFIARTHVRDKTPAEMEALQRRSDATRALRQGDPSQLRDLATSGQLTRRQLQGAEQRVVTPKLITDFRGLPLDQAEQVWRLANDDERAILGRTMQMKRQNAAKAGRRVAP